MEKRKSKINGKTLIEEIVEKHPKLVRPLQEHGIVCIRCGEPVWGSLEEMAGEKGIKNLDEIVKKMNEIIENEQKE